MVAATGYNKPKVNAMNRKQFVKLAGCSAAVAATGGLAGCANGIFPHSAAPVSASHNGARAEKVVYVPNGKNRFQQELMIWGAIPLQIKVSGKDTDGSLFVFEHAKMGKGGPPRHEGGGASSPRELNTKGKERTGIRDKAVAGSGGCNSNAAAFQNP
ncbi:hypothetical protein [Hymenobacter roseosalivarius]|uniref:hypothetical protein n=1 Tax=Hymenobacter roseosalivarius TaxID=89967 RepID=UPI000A05F1FC|nr:hypothetical protein [Hymenobacter roseosalivarius]